MKTIYHTDLSSVKIKLSIDGADIFSPVIDLSFVGDMSLDSKDYKTINLPQKPDLSSLFKLIQNYKSESIPKDYPVESQFNLFSLITTPSGKYKLNKSCGFNSGIGYTIIPFYSISKPDMSRWRGKGEEKREEKGKEKEKEREDFCTRLTPQGYRLMDAEFNWYNPVSQKFEPRPYKIVRLNIMIGNIMRDFQTLGDYNIKSVIIEPIYEISMLNRLKKFFISFKDDKKKDSLKPSLNNIVGKHNLSRDILKYIATCNGDITPNFMRVDKNMFSLIFNPVYLKLLVNNFKSRRDFPYWFCRPIVIKPWMNVESVKDPISKTIEDCKKLLERARSYILKTRMHETSNFFIGGSALTKIFYNVSVNSIFEIYISSDYDVNIGHNRIRLYSEHRTPIDTIAGFDMSIFQIGYTSDHQLLISPAFLYTFFHKENLMFMFTNPVREIGLYKNLSKLNARSMKELRNLMITDKLKTMSQEEWENKIPGERGDTMCDIIKVIDDHSKLRYDVSGYHALRRYMGYLAYHNNYHTHRIPETHPDPEPEHSYFDKVPETCTLEEILNIIGT